MNGPNFLFLHELSNIGRRNLGEEGHYTFLSRLYATIEKIIGLYPQFTILNYRRENGGVAPTNAQDYETYKIERHPFVEVDGAVVSGYPLLGSATGIAKGKLRVDEKKVVTLGHGYFKARQYPISDGGKIVGWVVAADVTDFGKIWQPHCALYIDDEEGKNLPSIILAGDEHIVSRALSSNLEEITLHSFAESGTIKSAPLIVEYKPLAGAKSDILIAHGDSIPVSYDTEVKGYFAVEDNGTGIEVLLRVLHKLRNNPIGLNQGKSVYWVFTFDEETTRLQAGHALDQIEQLTGIDYVINVDTISQLGNLSVRGSHLDDHFRSMRRKLLGDAKVFSMPQHTNSDIEFAAVRGYKCYDFLTTGRDPRIINGQDDRNLPTDGERLERVTKFILQMMEK